MINKSLITLILSVIAFIAIYRVGNKYSRNKKVKSSVDGNFYNVKNRGNPQMELESANTLAMINRKITSLLVYLRSNQSSQSEEESRWVRQLINNYDPSSLSESTEGDYSSLNTYTINKGEKISFCLRCRNCKTKKVEPINVLMFVAIHELAHVANVEEGHGYKFQKINKFLLTKATESGNWVYENYSENPVGYCNIVISSLPTGYSA